MMDMSVEAQKEFERVVERAHLISADVGREVEQILSVGVHRPLNRAEATRLLTKVVTVLKEATSAADGLEGDVDEIVEEIVRARNRLAEASVPSLSPESYTVQLVPHNGTQPSRVEPVPYFHGRPVPMNSGYAVTNEIRLWEDNARLEIHIDQFRNEHGRNPGPDELLDVMLSRMPLKGIPNMKGDQFKIVDLARSIAINGVRRPPILDLDGTLLDGNRRVAACYYILHNDEFSYEQKQRAEKIFVWQLTEHATGDDKRAVVVALNFEPDHKLDWPEYVKAKKLYEDWQAMLSVEPRAPGPQRAAQMKRELSVRYALGPDTRHVNRYLKMMDWSIDFKEYHVEQKHRDNFEVEHHTEQYFQYFDEFSKGTKPGGVAHTLNQDETYRNLAFDLLYDGKIKNWDLVRNLRYDDEEVREGLAKARAMTDLEEAQDLVEDTLTDAKNRRRQYRVVGANTRIKQFARWLENLPLSAFRDDIRPENLDALLRALRLVENQIRAIIREVDG